MSDTVKTIALIKAFGGSGSGNGNSNGGVLIVGVDETTGELDHTWQQIDDAVFNKMMVALQVDDAGPLSYYYLDSIAQYQIDFFNSHTTLTFICSTADDYPTIASLDGGGSADPVM